jgi:protein-tyrosine-phosphatase
VPSANPSGQPPALSADEVTRYFGGRIDAIVDGGTVLLKQASTVVQVDEDGYEVLREGIITREMVHQLVDGSRILFVCTGNTCRSPMAAEIYKKLLAARLGKATDELQELGYRITSAGTFAVQGAYPSDHAVEVLREMGCDLSRHSSQPVTPELLAQAVHVYALGHSHYHILERMIAELDSRPRPVLDMLTEVGVTDPVGGDKETYRECAKEIEASILRILPR